MVRSAWSRRAISQCRGGIRPRLLHSENAIRAFRSFNLGLMNQGPTPWGANHCFALANQFFDEPITVGRLQ
jgi:hypothetical protein